MARYAIVGLSCLFPGASTVEEFWRNLVAGTDSRSDGAGGVLGEIWPAEAGDRHRVYCTRGGFTSTSEFDPRGYRLDADYLAELDQAFQWPLRVARDALVDCGRADDPAMLARTGLVLGNYSFPTEQSCRLALPLWRGAVLEGLRQAGIDAPAPDCAGPLPAPENMFVGGLPARVATAALGLEGPHFALDAACSSALYGLKLACDYLDAGRAELMLAGAVCAPDPLLIHLSFSDLHAYPANGFSQPFDARSAGIITGQGAGMLAVRRLEDALREGDRIHAVIEGIALANDGAGRHMLAPSADGQVETYELAYAQSGVDPAQIGYLECHATGTPLGDRTELESLTRFFDGRGAVPLLGSVKGNVGHLLTVAGLTSMLKVILAMQHGVIPPTPGIGEPLDFPAAARVVRAGRRWSEQSPRRAAVSAFGFGGTNAHVILSDPGAAHVPAPGLGDARAAVAGRAPATEPARPSASPRRMAIRGMGAQLGGLDGLAAFERASWDATQCFGPLPRERWRGVEQVADAPDPPEAAYAHTVAVDPVSYRIPPRELQHFNRQHLLLLAAADEALRDAGYERGEGPVGRTGLPQRRRVAVVMAMELEASAHGHRARYDLGRYLRSTLERSGTPLSEAALHQIERAAKDSIHDAIEPNEVLSYIGSIAASRISSLWNLTGPSFTISADGAAGARALEVASLLLADETIESVVVGAVDLAASAENLDARLRRGDDLDGWHPGDGSVAVVVARSEQVPRGARVYAHIDGLAILHSNGSGNLYAPSPQGVAQVAADALAAAGAAASDVGLVELSAGGAAEEDAAELTGLAETYAAPGSEADRTCAIGAVKAIIGDTQCASALAGVVRAALCVHGGYVPGLPADAALRPQINAALERTCFYRAAESRPWLRTGRSAPRRAAVSCVGFGGAHAHIVLSSDRHAGEFEPVAWRRAGGPVLMPVGATSLGELLLKICELRARLAEGGESVWGLANEQLGGLADARLRAVFVGREPDGLLRELHAAERGIAAAHAAGGDWSTPAGSYFTARPVSREGKVAFVYPGAFNSYVGLGADLFRYFPGLMPSFEDQCEEPARMLRDRLLHPRTLAPPGRRELMHRETELIEDVPTMLATGTSFALLYTELLRDLLGVAPDGAIGYSLGESSMMFAMGGWEESARDDVKISSTRLFVDRLCGPKRTVRELWGIPEQTPDAEVWGSFVLLADPAVATKAARRHARVFVTHINSPREVVIAGDPRCCREVIAELGCRSARSPFAHVMHCPVVDGEQAELAELNRYPTRQVESSKLYSALGCAPVDDFSRDAVAGRIARTLTRAVDFAGLVQAAYADGFRYFVEVGPGATCTRWVRDTLGDRAHVAASIDRRGAGTPAGVAPLLARLLSHGVPVDLAPLLAAPAGGDGPRRRVRMVVPCGGEPIPQLVAAATRAAVEAAPAAVVPSPSPPVPIPVTPLLEVPVPRPREVIELDSELEPVELAASAALARVGESVSASVSPLSAVRDLPTASGPGRPAAPATAPKRQGVVFDEADLVEFATGSVANVFGSEFAPVDGYARRVRLPAPPYLFVTRVTALEAERGGRGRAFIQTELDVPPDAWYLVDGQVPPAVAIEAGQCDLLLVSYLGIDFENRGERVYRLLDSRLIWHGDLPRAGQTLRYEITIERFVSTPGPTLFFFRYDCYADGELILELRDACAGFFTDQELAAGTGIVEGVRERRRRERWTPASFKPLARSPRRSLSGEQLSALRAGQIAAVFGPEYDQPGCNQSLRPTGGPLAMIDEVTEIDRGGGPRGLGSLVALKRLDPDGWYFPCHFPDDPVLAGSLVADGAVQLLQIYALYLGLQLTLPDARFQPVADLRTEVKVRGQITPSSRVLRYAVSITRVELVPRPTVVADVVVYRDDVPVISITDLGIQVREKPESPYRPGSGGVVSTFLGRRNSAGEPALLNELHMAHAAKGDLAMAMGPEFEIYRTRRAPYIPNGDFLFVDRVMGLEGKRGELRPGAEMVTEFDAPPDAWYFEQNAFPNLPNCVLMETSLQAAILLGYYLGVTLGFPEQEFSIRNLEGHATLVRHVDLRGKTIRQRSRMLTNAALPGAMLQRFAYELSADGEVFYVGESLFGYFTEGALATQVGLDGGREVPLWIEQAAPGFSEARQIALRAERAHYEQGDLRIGHGRLDLVDQLELVDGGGNHGAGYIRGDREIAEDEWYFDCHFHRDPVMPGSLGVEAIIQALQVWSIEHGLGAGFVRPRFAVPRDVRMSWKYRGQVLRTDRHVSFELHLKEVRAEPERLLVIADASLFKPGLRIYELTDIAIEIREAIADEDTEELNQ